MCGVGFSGKSTLAKQISEHTGATLISQDALFFEKQNELNLDLDNEYDWRTRVHMCRDLTTTELQAGKSVVYDDTNHTYKMRQKLRDIAEKTGSITKVIFLDTPIEIQKQRVLQNKTEKNRHDVDQQYLDEAIAELETPTEDENVCTYKPDSNIEEFIAQIKNT